MAKDKRGPYLLIKNYGLEGHSITDYETPEDALADAEFNRGDIIAKVLDVVVVDPDKKEA